MRITAGEYGAVARNITAKHPEAEFPHVIILKMGERVKVIDYPDRPDSPVEVEFEGRDELKQRTVYLPLDAINEG